MRVLGFDIGGTKCAVIYAEVNGEDIEILAKDVCKTDLSISAEKMIEKMITMADAICDIPPEKIGISCGGPLDSSLGIIMSPPNLPGWDNIPIVKIIEEHYGVSAILQNDANAGAVAEWKFGAARGCKNAVFLTFGTGLGAGLILNGKLYDGTNGNAGEVGHIRIEKDGPIGYGKHGSFEGFCSGGGIGRLGYAKALEMAKHGKYPRFYKEGMSEADVSAKTIADAAHEGDECAKEVYKICGEKLGMGLSVIIDILNPEVIAIGGVFTRAHDLLWESARRVIREEALALSVECCRVVKAELSEKIGDYAAIATALL